jgi:hypothetical protein
MSMALVSMLAMLVAATLMGFPVGLALFGSGDHIVPAQPVLSKP